ncbi:zinc finger protein BRUTUS-like At1g74770 isoform X1 [Solanum lycopersicum]|uniref:zinc finger protein BRUTUS-like At1g74770 isoform X1 n=1 Tax=Solanum lycopersicum TaxID=4081 RepID=UPI0002BCA129|nr:zinc finger protein BRUTUS-like At1g74770 isoform X1 [Solanum lycopersicum]
MGGKEDDDDTLALPLPSCSDSVVVVDDEFVKQLVDSPILFFVLSHKAVEIELHQIRCVAVEALDSGGEVVDELCKRLHFLKIVYKYHCVAEDEVLFQALDAQVKNVVFTYSLEHNSIDVLFSSIFDCLDRLQEEKDEISVLFNELTCSIGTIQTTISQHMLKEEEQIFPLMMEKFSSEEQARLIWQYLCSVPLMILEDFMRWLTASLSSHERAYFLKFIHIVLPEEKLIQEVFISWIDENKEASSRSCIEDGKGAKFHYGKANMKYIFEMDVLMVQCKEMQHQKASEEHNPIDGFHIWHAAITQDLRVIMDELYQIRNTLCVSTLLSVITQLKFFADVFTFYSNALDQIYYPLVNQLNKDSPSPFYEQFIERSQIEELQKLLYYKLHEEIQIKVFVDMLCQEVELFVGRMNKKLQFLETEVFVFIRKTCSYELQLWLLYISLHMLPLGLLKCMIIWFSAHLSENESKMMLNNIKLGSSVVSKSFSTLLYEWVRMGYSGKISVEKFRKDLEEMFSSGTYLFEKWCKNSGSSSSHSEIHSPDRPYHPSTLDNIGKHDTPYSNGINLRIFFSDSLNGLFCHPETAVDGMRLSRLDVKPIDFFHFFHKALKKDLQYALSLSVKLAEDVGLLAEFERHFHHVRFLYQLHSKSEDEIAFPALESKGQLRNVSHSYGIDHKLEVEQFDRISIVLNEITSLQGCVDMIDSNKLKYKKLCLNLHDTCISMHKTLTDHIYREEVELWPLFKEHFSVEEQEKIIGDMLGRTKAEILREMIPWLMASLTPEEEHGIMSIWRKVTKNTKFFEWLGEWWEGIKRDESVNAEKGSKLSLALAVDPLEVVSTYLPRDDFWSSSVCHEKGENFLSTESADCDLDQSGSFAADKSQKAKGNKNVDRSTDITQHSTEVDKKICNDTIDIADKKEITCQDIKLYEQSRQKNHKEHHLILTQDKLVDAIRRVSRDFSLDSEKKSHLMQSLLMSQWILTQEKFHSEVATAKDKEKITGQCPSFRDKTESVFGCKHYKRNCKLLAPCCNELFPCIRCHDEISDHFLDRKSITQMMCMKCLKIQPICPSCLTLTCNNFSMAKYYCRICIVFDDDRQIYHCPFCNLCRVGEGLGVGVFHCMTCNACMLSKSLSIHTCRENCLEDNCPICREDIFTSATPVKQLPCGHLMHSTCFQDYTFTHYTCPICSKTIGDMKVLFELLDAFLSEEKIPEEYAGQIQVILCNDCQKRGTASFHWHYHKCPYCGSYNTRLI